MLYALILSLLMFWTFSPYYVSPDRDIYTQTQAVDVNGDGQLDTISLVYSIDAWEFTLKVNAAEVESLFDIDSGFEIIDLDVNDTTKEIMIPSMEPSDDPHCLIFGYDGDKIFFVGGTHGFRRIMGDGVMYTGSWRGFWTATDKWVLDADTHTLHQIPQELYFVEEVVAYGISPFGHKVKEPFVLYDTPRSETVAETIDAGSTILLLACKLPTDESPDQDQRGSPWYLIKSETGILGWAQEGVFGHKVEDIHYSD